MSLPTWGFQEAVRIEYLLTMESVKKEGMALKHASVELKNNTEVVLAAVSQNGWALMYVSDYFRNNVEVVLAAVSQAGGKNPLLRHASRTLKNSPTLSDLAYIEDKKHRADACADPVNVWKVSIEHQAIQKINRSDILYNKFWDDLKSSLQIVDMGGNAYPLKPGWWSIPGGDLVAQALEQHPALVEANQRFVLVTSDGNATPATVIELLCTPTPPKAILVWLTDEE